MKYLRIFSWLEKSLNIPKATPLLPDTLEKNIGMSEKNRFER